jgi:hypothetical protein
MVNPIAEVYAAINDRAEYFYTVEVTLVAQDHVLVLVTWIRGSERSEIDILCDGSSIKGPISRCGTANSAWPYCVLPLYCVISVGTREMVVWSTSSSRGSRIMLPLIMEMAPWSQQKSSWCPDSRDHWIYQGQIWHRGPYFAQIELLIREYVIRLT